jgi:glucose-1-phosphatase
MTEIKAIIFDLGKVIFDVSFDRTFESWASNSNKQFADIKNIFRFDDLYEKFERDEITSPEFRKLLSKKLDITISDQLFDKGWCNLYLDVYPEIENLLIKLKTNYRLVALTNTNKIHETVWKVRYSSILQHFEKVFSSSDIKTRKPEEQSFKIVLDYLQLKPQETLFVDDNEDNTKGAESLGIRSILVSSPQQMINDLGKIVKI